MLSLAQAARLYAIPLVDYGSDRGTGLLVSSGCGIMMATMDAVPALRWCVDIDGFGPTARLDDFLLMAERIASPIGLCGWFSLTDPAPLRRAALALARPPVVYTGNVALGVEGEHRTLRAFLAGLREAAELEEYPLLGLMTV